MLRIKDEARWLFRVLTSMLPLCERIFVLDDHSSDDTPGICRMFKEVTFIESPFEGLNEVKDKNFLLRHIEEKCKPDTFVVCIDGDEEIESGGQEKIEALSKSNWHGSYSPKIVYLWDREDQQRIDGCYSRMHRPSFFRLGKGLKFVSNSASGFHCSNAPNSLQRQWCDVRLLHYGYLYREDRIRKWNFYNQNDPKNRREGYDANFPERRSYPHIVQGDIPEVPADAVLKHAGPLRLESISEAEIADCVDISR